MKLTHPMAAVAAVAIGALVPATDGPAALASAARDAVQVGAATVHAGPPGHQPGTDTAGGTRLWLATYTGTGSGDATAVAVSPGGSTVFVAGGALVAYDARTGAQLWAAATVPNPLPPFEVAVNRDGSTVFVTGGSTSVSGYQTIAYDAATGAQLWEASYHGPGGSDRPQSIAISPDGSTVFVTGDSSTTTKGFPNAYATVAYDASTGAQLWAARYSDGNTDAQALSVAVNPDGAQVYVTGASHRPTGTKYSYATVAYSATTGAVAWVDRYSPGHPNAAASSVAVSPDGSQVYVTGTADTRHGQQYYATLAYAASTGATLWVARYDGPKYGNYSSSMALSSDGSELVVTGQGKSRSGYYLYATVAYNAANGAQLWARHYGPTDFGRAESVAISPDGSQVFVTGDINTAKGSGNLEWGTVAYNGASGAQLWARRYAGGQAYAVAVSPDGSEVFVTGGSSTLAYSP